MKSLFNKTSIYLCLFLILFSSLTPLKAFAVYFDADFFSSNDILFYDCRDKGSNDNSSSEGKCDSFDTTKLVKYEDCTDTTTDSIDTVGSQDGKKYAISLGVSEEDIKIWGTPTDASELDNMIRNEIATQWPKLSDADKHGATQADAQHAIISYSHHEGNQMKFQEINGQLVPIHDSTTYGPLSATEDKYQGCKNKQYAFAWDIRYAVYKGVQENIGNFVKNDQGEGLNRWHYAIGYTFLPKFPNCYWDGQGAGNCRPSVSEAEWNTFANETDYVCQGSSSGGVDELDGYTLPAKTGPTGTEEEIDERGVVKSEWNSSDWQKHRVTFSGFAKLGQEYRDYYITMRWNYAAWKWQSSEAKNIDSKQMSWMQKDGKPKIVLVTNPRTGKSIYAAAIEAGPQAGVNDTNANDRILWKNGNEGEDFWRGTPPGYTGLVSGFPPKALEALGGVKTGYGDGTKGDQLTYQWAPDQNIKPGPVSGAIPSSTSPDTTSSPSGSGGQTVIVIDPGHTGGGTSADEQVPGVSYSIKDSPGATKEDDTVYEVAEKLKTKLDTAGYKTIMTRGAKDSPPKGLVSKANIANDSEADLALSIHTDPGMNGGQIYKQAVGLYRGGDANHQPPVTFTDSEVAKKSQEYAEKFKIAREKNENTSIVVKDNTYPTTLGIGNLAWVQLLSKRPWVYNEAGGTNINADSYANGLYEGVTSSIGPNAHNGSGSSNQSKGTCDDGSSSTNGAVQGDIVKTAINLAWPDNGKHGDQVADAKPEYVAAIKEIPALAPAASGATAEGKTLISACDRFVSTVMISSGVDANFPSVSGAQQAYMQKNDIKYTHIADPEDKVNTSTLQPGDIVVNSSHVFIYVGEQGGGFTGRSASWGDYVPKATTPGPDEINKFYIYRVKS